MYLQDDIYRLYLREVLPACSLICGNTTPKMIQAIDIDIGFCFSSFSVFFSGTDKHQQQSFSRCFVVNRDKNKWFRLNKKVVRMKNTSRKACNLCMY